MAKTIATRILQKMYRDLEKEPCSYFSCRLIDDNIFRWIVTIIGPEGTLYDGGIFPSEIDFPDDFPESPPTMRFLCPMWHPNISDKDGTVCISILQRQGYYGNEYKSADDLWQPTHTVESIVICVIAMLSDPITISPLNVKANHDFLFDKEAYKQKVRRCTSRSVDY